MSDSSQKTLVKWDTTGDGVPDDCGDTAPPPSALVWGARILSLSAIAAIVGYLLYLWLIRPYVPAQFDIALDFDAAVERDDRWVLPVSLTNSSTEGIGSVKFEVSQGDVTRSSTITLMGEGETADLEIIFPQRPTETNTTAEVVSYQSP